LTILPAALWPRGRLSL